jgi:hypothetical protein
MTVAELRTADNRDAAIEYVLEAERSHGVRTYSIGEESAALFALRATSLAEYVCAFNLALADRKRQSAARDAAEAGRRRPSGRKVHTASESQGLRDDAARDLEQADAAEAEPLAAIGVSDLIAADLAVAHMLGPDAVSRPGSFEQEWDAALEVTKRVRAFQEKRRRWLFVRGRAAQAS